MRRLVFSIIVASGLVMVGPSSAFAEEPDPTVSVPATPGKKICKITDDRLDELSGIVATRTGFIVVNDSAVDPTHKKIFFLNTKCKVTDEVSFSGRGPRDPEDLVLSADGKTLWIADIGDNNYAKDDRRETLTLWSMPADGSAKPKIHRVAYPEGDHHDAEAMLLNGDGTPLIITKEIGRPAGIYQPAAKLQVDNETGVPLKRVGELTVTGTETPSGPYGRIGNKTIDGGAVAPGGGRVVLRTYTDALEWDVPNGDVVAALQTKPRTTGLPNEPLGEAISYSADGKYFFTVSDMNAEAEAPPNHILQYTPATTVAATKKATDDGKDGAPWYADLTLGQITAMVGGLGLIGLILAGVGAAGIVRHRKRVAADPVAGGGGGLSDEPETELIGVGGAAARSGPYGSPRKPTGVYGAGAAAGPAGGAPGAGAGSGGVYGGRPASGQQPPSRKGVYGGQPPRGPQGQPAGAAAQGQPARGRQGQPVRGEGVPARGPQGQPGGGPQGQPGRGGTAGQPARGRQGQPVQGQPVQGQPVHGTPGQPARGRQGQPGQGSPGQPARGRQGQPGGGPQGQPARGRQEQPGQGSPGQPARAPQGQPARGPEGQPARAPQGQPARGQQGQPARGQGQVPRGPQGQPARAPQGQPARGPQGQQGGASQGQPGRGQQGQPPRHPQGQPGRAPQAQPPRGPQGQPPRGAQGQPSRGVQGQPSRGVQSQIPYIAQGQSLRGVQPSVSRSAGVYGQTAGHAQPSSGYVNYNGRP